MNAPTAQTHPHQTRRGMPPPCWFSSLGPYPIALWPLREGCTRGHIYATACARHVMTELYALVAIGEFDISQFLAGGGDLRPAAKYVDHLRGRRTLHDEAIKALDDQIVRFANIMWFDNVLTRDQDVPAEVKVGDHYKTVMQVAAEFQPGLLRPDTWCLLNGHIVKAWAHRTPKARSRYQMSGWWPELLRYEANARGMQNVCRCHVIQTLYEQGNPGPPNEQSLFGRGGRRRTRRNSPITRTHDR